MYSDSLLDLAGFVLAHAMWSVSDLPDGELLVPLAIVEKSGDRQLLRFEGESQEQAIAEGTALLARREQEVDAWACAREGQIGNGPGLVDVLVVEAKSRGADGPLVFVQPFRPFASGKFRLLGAPMVIVGGKTLSETDAEPLLQGLFDGIQSHAKAAEHWADWTSD
jgi:hypothetical protein